VDPWTIAFLVGGLALIASEFVAPSLFTVFLGVAALMTAGLRGVGLVDSVPVSFLLWSVISLGLVIPFRPLVQKYLPGGKSVAKKDSTDVENDRDSMGEIVEVVEDVADDKEGRIRFQGTTWTARMTTGSLKKGEKAQLVYREGSIWIIEAVGDGSARDLFAVDQALAEQQVKETAEKQR
jgi:membrane protein implicated in regulation of membrane protease activity